MVPHSEVVSRDHETQKGETCRRHDLHDRPMEESTRLITNIILRQNMKYAKINMYLFKVLVQFKGFDRGQLGVM